MLVLNTPKRFQMDQTFATFLIDLVKSGSFDNYELLLIIGAVAYFLRGTNIASLLRNKSENKPESGNNSEEVAELRREMRTKNAAIAQEMETLHDEHASIMQLLKDIKRFLFKKQD